MIDCIQVERLEHGPEISRLEPEWEDLLRCSVRPTIFASFDYVQTSLHHFTDATEVFYLLFRDGETHALLAIFPLSMWKRKIHGVELRAVAHALPPQTTEVDKPCPIIHREHEQKCWERLRSYFCDEFKQWDLIELDELIAESYFPLSAKTLFPFPQYWTRVKLGPDSPVLKLDGEWEDFWNKHRKLRKKCGRLERRIEKLSYRITNDPSDVDQCLKEYIETENVSWKEGEMVAYHHAFYEELLPRLAAKRQVWFGMMYDAERVVSIEMAYSFLNKVYFCHGTYTPEYAVHSPGMVNSCWFIKHFLGRGFVEGDYLAGFAEYVNPWADRQEHTRNVTVRRMGWKNHYLAAWHLLGKLKRKIRTLHEIKKGDDCVKK